MKSISEFTPRSGGVRFQTPEGEWIAANPHDALYSTVSMSATQFWNGKKWRSVLSDGNVGDANDHLEGGE